MAMNKKKTTAAIVAGVTAVALLLGGTFAWTSISQRALNETAGIVNVGGRLHDDFNGENKDIYVENFTDPLNGGQPIYARIRLDEYMEVGSEAGKYDAESNSYVAGRNAKPVVDGTDIADVSTWTTHVPTTACTVCATSTSCAIHDHWKWTMGNTEAKYFMPTFNKDKDSLDADVNGTYHGKDDTDKVYYDDYVEYVKDQTVTKDAYYDDDTDTRPNVHEPLAGAIAKQETHTAKLTGTATVITMAEFLDPNGNNGAPGNFWVYDTDGWAYWANPIMPGESTGFLLDSIKMEKNPGEKCYYAINVVAQFATVGDWEYFEDKEGNLGLAEDSNALKVMQAAAANVPTVTVSSDSTVVAPGQTAQFSATVSQGQVAGANDPAVEWSLYNADGSAYTGASSINASGLLTVAKDEAEGTILTVVARSTEYLGAVGMKSISIKTPDVTVSIAAKGGLKAYDAGTAYTETFTATVSGEDATLGSLSWSVTDGDGKALTNTTLETTSDGATLKISETETALKVVVTAAYTLQNGYKATAEYVVNRNMDIATSVDSTKVYGLLTDDGTGNGTYAMTFVRSDDTIVANQSTYNGASIAYVYDYTESETNVNKSYFNVVTERDKVTKVSFANKISPVSTDSFFWGFSALKTVDFTNLDTSKTENMFSMFRECSSMESIAFPDGFGSSATTMRYFLSDCTNLSKVTLGKTFGGDSLTNAITMFDDCKALQTLDLTNMVTSTSTGVSLNYMFYGCSELTSVTMPQGLVVSAGDSQEGSLYCTFENCKKLKNIYNINTWDTSNVVKMVETFCGCEQLETLDISNWKTGNVTTFFKMFASCKTLSSLAINFDTKSVTQFDMMFATCKVLETIPGAENWNTSNATSMIQMFGNCSNLKLDCSGWDVRKIPSTPTWFADGAPGVIRPQWGTNGGVTEE